MRKFLLAAAAVSALTFVAFSSQAQMGQGMGQGMMGQGQMWGQGCGYGQGPMGGPMGGMMMGMMGQGAMMGGMMMQGGFDQHIEGRLAFLKTELAITAEQEGLWSAYADALRQASATMVQHHQEMMQLFQGGTLPQTLPEQLALHQEMMSEGQSVMASLSGALLPLYDALSPQQKKVADELFGGPMMGMQ